jgi:hypothetical protein
MKLPRIRSYGKLKANGLAISLRLGGKKDDRRRTHGKSFPLFFVAVL